MADPTPRPGTTPPTHVAPPGMVTRPASAPTTPTTPTSSERTREGPPPSGTLPVPTPRRR